MSWRAVGARWRTRTVGVVEAVDRRPVMGWVGAVSGTSLLVAGLGSTLGALQEYLLSPFPIFWTIALVATVALLGVAITLGFLIADLAQRWFGLSWWRSRGTAYTALICGLLPWMIPHGPSFGRAREAVEWSVAFYAAGVLVLPATALLLVPGRRSRALGAACLLAATAVWLPARHEWLAAETRANLLALGSPPRPLLRLIDWDGVTSGGLTYRDGRVTVEYGLVTPSPVPDGSHVATLITEPLPAGDESLDPCREATDAERRLVGVAPTEPDPSSPCREMAPQEWQAGERTVVLRSDGCLVLLVADADAGEFGNPATLLSVLRSQHVADDAEVRGLNSA